MQVDDKIGKFKKWLDENGALYDKVIWPSYKTASGMRGAIANVDIATNEVMFEIPSKLMLSPPKGFKNEVIGEELSNSLDVLKGDVLLTVYFMYEKLLGEKSFWYPYFNILPEISELDNLHYWTNDELMELQSDYLYHKAKQNATMINNIYNRSIVIMNTRYPQKFPLHIYTLQLFSYCYSTIQARAFGRRLPWTALVPFADCLNHTNLQTKYSYTMNISESANTEDNSNDSDEGYVFKLFPTGNNLYKQGSEVFNSYGKRNNDNLLTDYGFSILDNEWDEVSIQIYLSKHLLSYAVSSPSSLELCANNAESLVFQQKVKIAMSLRFSNYYQIVLNSKNFPWQVLPYIRLTCLNSSDIEIYWKCFEISNELDCRDYNFNDSIETHINSLENPYSSLLMESLGCLTSMNDENTRRRWTDLYRPILEPISLNNEITSVKWLHACLSSYLTSLLDTTRTDVSGITNVNDDVQSGHLTSISYDELLHSQLYQFLNLSCHQEEKIEDDDYFKYNTENDENIIQVTNPWRLLSALNYRLTRKHIIFNHIMCLDSLLKVLEDFQVNTNEVSKYELEQKLLFMNSNSSKLPSKQNVSSYVNVLLHLRQ